MVHRRPCLQHLAFASLTQAVNPDIGSESRFLPTHLHSTPPVRDWEGSRRNIAMPFDVEKLEWCDYPTVKKYEDTFIRFDRIHERDRQTHTHTQIPHDGIGRACVASRGKNYILQLSAFWLVVTYVGEKSQTSSHFNIDIGLPNFKTVLHNSSFIFLLSVCVYHRVATRLFLHFTLY